MANSVHVLTPDNILETSSRGGARGICKMWGSLDSHRGTVGCNSPFPTLLQRMNRLLPAADRTWTYANSLRKKTAVILGNSWSIWGPSQQLSNVKLS